MLMDVCVIPFGISIKIDHDFITYGYTIYISTEINGLVLLLSHTLNYYHSQELRNLFGFFFARYTIPMVYGTIMQVVEPSRYEELVG